MALKAAKALRRAASVLTIAADTAEAVKDMTGDPTLKKDIANEIRESAFRIGSRVLNSKANGR